MTTLAPIHDQLAALADDTRSRTLLVLDRHEMTVGELTQVLQLPQSTVSRHLKVLSDAGWVSSRAEGTSRLYRLAEPESGARKLWLVVRDRVSTSNAAKHDASRANGVLTARRARSQEFFAGAAGEWSALRDELFGTRADLTAMLGLLDDEWVVGDLGCGTGQASERLAPFVRQIVAVDASRAMLATARRRLSGVPNVELRHGELESLPIENDELDAAVIVLALHYVAEPAMVLSEAARTLKHGGKLLVVDMVPHEREELRHKMGHVWRGFPEAQLVEWLRAAGFDKARYHELPTDPQAKGPGLFVCTARSE